MCLRRSLVRALNPGLVLIFVHGIVSCPLSLPRVRSVEFHVFQDDRFRELLHWLPRWQHRFQKVKLVLVKGLGELDMEFDVEVAWFVMSLGRHTLTVNDFQVT